MGAKDYLAAVCYKLLDGGKSSDYSVVVGDNSVLERNVEIATNQNLLALDTDVINADFVQTCHKYISFI